MKTEPNNEEARDIRFEDRNDYLYAFFTGKRDGLADAIRFWRRAIEECNKRNYGKLLIEQDFPKPLSMDDAFCLADAIAKMPVGKIKIAFADRDYTQNVTNQFAETVAVNRGVFGRVFTNLHEAETWLVS